MGAWRAMGDGRAAIHKSHTEAERDTLIVCRQDFFKAQRLIRKAS